MSFNPRAHEGRDLTFVEKYGSIKGFNPRAHEGRDVPVLRLLIMADVSIHAPTRGATRLNSLVNFI